MPIPLPYALCVAGAVTTTDTGRTAMVEVAVRSMAGDVFFVLLDAEDANMMLGLCEYDGARMRKAALMLCRLAYLDRTDPWVAA